MIQNPRQPIRKDDTSEDAGALIMLLSLTEKNGPAWAYVVVPTSKAAELISFSGKHVAPEDYGKVLLRGDGEAPPAEAREYIYDHYGFDS